MGAEQSLLGKAGVGAGALSAHVVRPAVGGDTGAHTEGRDYYGLLGVRRDATPDELRAAYRREAVRVHPDKCPGDASASARFQQLSEAYQVLSDPRKRQAYDAHGLAGVDGASHCFHPEAFFACLFGSEAFSDTVGTTTVAAAAELAVEAGGAHNRLGAIDHGRLAEAQAARHALLADTLRARLEKHVLGELQAWEEETTRLARRLRRASYGRELLGLVAEVYLNRAKRWLCDPARCLDGWKTLGFDVIKFECQREGALAKAKFASLGSMMNFAGAASRAERPDDETMGYLLDALWETTAADVHEALKVVCERVLDESGASWAVREARARALLALGERFAAAAEEGGGGVCAERASPYLTVAQAVAEGSRPRARGG